LRDLLGLKCASSLCEVDVVLVEILVLQHEGVLIVDNDVLVLHDLKREAVARVDAFVGGSCGGGLADGRSCGPDERSRWR